MNAIFNFKNQLFTMDNYALMHNGITIAQFKAYDAFESLEEFCNSFVEKLDL